MLVPSACEALENRDYDSLGRIIDASHEATVNKLRNTVPETAWLPREARKLGAVAASAFGAGFGGSCYAFVKKEEVERLVSEWEENYEKEFPSGNDSIERSFFVTDAEGGARFLE